MKYYVDITLLPDVDIHLYFLWSKVYQQLHLALVEQQDATGSVRVGVAFPGYRFEETHKTLGQRLRLCAETEADLAELKLAEWLARLSDYVHLTSIRPVPDKVDGFACFKRVQIKSNLERLAKRKARRLGIAVSTALESFGDKKERMSQAPFIRLGSLSSGHSFRLMVTRQLMAPEDSAHPLRFSTYGLSSEERVGAVPLF